MSKASRDPQPLSSVAVIDNRAMADIMNNVTAELGASIGVFVSDYMAENPVTVGVPEDIPIENLALTSDTLFCTAAEKQYWSEKVESNDPRLSDARTPKTHTHDYEPANVNIQAHISSVHAPAGAQVNADITKAEIEAKLTGPISTHSHAGGSGDGFIINVQALTSSPTDSQTVYFGMLPKAPTTTANISKIYIRKACTLKMAEIYCYAGTAGTNEAWSLYVRKNNTTDTLIKTLNVNTNERVFTNSALNIPLVAGDYLEIKGVQPLWATNPATCIYGGYLYFE